jgi:HEPN domain-containing protein
MRARTRNARRSKREASSSFAGQADQGPAANERVKAARWYLERAYELLAHGDPYDAAEKVWAAVKAATEALTIRVLAAPVPPKGSGWRIFVKEAFLKAGLSEEEAEKLAAYFIEVRDRLHGACFYGLLYEENEHKPLMERAKWYIDLVERVLERLPG